MGYFLGLIFLKENLNAQQVFASLLIIAGAVIISLDLSKKIDFKMSFPTPDKCVRGQALIGNPDTPACHMTMHLHNPLTSIP